MLEDKGARDGHSNQLKFEKLALKRPVAKRSPGLLPPSRVALRWTRTLRSSQRERRRVAPSGLRLRHHARCRSLSIGSTWPLIDLAASEARNTASAAMSFGLIIALIDCAAIASARTSSTDRPLIWARPAKTRSMRSPSTAPGAIALARMPQEPSSIASVLVKPITAHLVAA